VTHVIPGRRPVAEALRADRRLTEVVVDERSAADLRDLTGQAGERGVRVRTAPRPQLDELSNGVLHQGVVALQREFPYVTLDSVGTTDLVVVLDGVTDPQNLGAIARSAEAAGAGCLVLPRRRSATVGPAAEKAAAGAFGWLRVAVVPNVAGALADLAQRGFWSVGLAGGGSDTIWSSGLLTGRVALVVGAEGSGLSRLVRERVDGLASIPMAGRLDSLNASAATAVALFEIVRRRTQPVPRAP
jgi:23S rRNA (guanosine2251-2'-O)-methyltransferase